MKVKLIVTMVCVILTAMAVQSTAAPAQAQAISVEKTAKQSHRFIIILRDISESFRFIDDSTKKIVSSINMMEPGDKVIMMDVGSSFLPEKSVRLQCQLPSVPEDVFDNISNVNSWKQKQKILDYAWARADKDKKVMCAWIKINPVKTEQNTDLYKALEYSALRFENENNGKSDKILIIMSDMINDSAGDKIKAESPPKNALNFKDTAVKILFVPWNCKSQYSAKKKEWVYWFEKRCNAKSCQIFEPAESKMIAPSNIVGNQTMPRKLRSPFEAE